MDYDYIIVGQGIAGTLLSHFLIEAKKKVLVIDFFNPSSSSNIAAGIIHPITGRRLVKTWMYEEAFPVAIETYLQLENKFNENFFNQIPIMEIFSSIKNKNDWEIKSAESGFGKLMNEQLAAGFNPLIDAPFGAIKVYGGGFLKLKELIHSHRNYLLENDSLRNEKFDFNEFHHDEKRIRYKNVSAQKIIFCEGYQAQQNPFFKSLPFQPAKGEVLILECDGLNEHEIINKSIFVLPLGNHLFKIGSTFDWNQTDNIPTEAAKEKLLKEFSSIIKTRFNVIEHFAAVRPTVKDRKPFLGFHSEYKNIGIFNGLGTKGVLLAPYLAKKMCDLLAKDDVD